MIEAFQPADYVIAGLAVVSAVLVALLVAFGIVRALVRRFVNGLLAQPADAIFGFLTGLVVVALLLAGWAFSGLYLEYSFLASEFARYVG